MKNCVGCNFFFFLKGLEEEATVQVTVEHQLEVVGVTKHELYLGLLSR